MARFTKMRRRFSNYRRRARVIIHRVRSRRRIRRKSFLEKNKSLIIIALLGGLGWFFRDKIKALFSKQ